MDSERALNTASMEERQSLQNYTCRKIYEDPGTF